jgi:hypothetical protein
VMERGRSAVALGLAGEERPWTGRPLPNASRFFRVLVCGRAADFLAGNRRQDNVVSKSASLEDSRAESEGSTGGPRRAAGLPLLTSRRSDALASQRLDVFDAISEDFPILCGCRHDFS